MIELAPTHGKEHGEAVTRLPQFVVVACLLLFAGPSAHAEGIQATNAAEPKRVLIIHSFGRDYAPFNSTGSAFRTELASLLAGSVVFHEASFEVERGGPPQDERPFIEFLISRYRGAAPDLTVTVGAPALRFYLRARPQLFPNTPLLVTGVDQRMVQAAPLEARDRAVSGQLDIHGAGRDILDLLPQTKILAVVVGASPHEQFWLKEVLRELAPLSARVRLLPIDGLTLDQLRERVGALPPDSAILYFLYALGPDGVPHENERALAAVNEASNSPVFGLYESQLGGGIVGGSLYDMRRMGILAARMGQHMLEGNGVHAASFVMEVGAPAFDWRQLKRWGVPESRLPPGSIVKFREPTVWQLYRWHIVAAALVLLLQAAFIVALLVERQRRQFAELESRKRLGEMAHLNRSVALGEMSASFAHELNQPLGAILNNAGAAEMLIKAGGPSSEQLNEILADIKRDNQRASDVITRLRAMLRKSEFELREVDLNAAVSDVARFVAAEASVRSVALRMELEPSLPAVRGDRVQLQQVVLNLALNGMDAMSSQASTTREMVIRTDRANDSEVQISVQDSGVGIGEDKLARIFEPFVTTKTQGMGLGLSISRTIIEAHGGRIWAERAVNRGAVLRFTVPLASAA